MSLQEEMHSLTQDIIGSYEARAAGLAALRAATTAQLKECDRAHQARAHQLHTDLANMRAGMRQAEAQRHSTVNAWLKDVASEHQAIAQQQRAHLAQSEAQRSSAVVAWLEQVTTARAAGHAQWQRMEATLQIRRAHTPRGGAPHGEEVPEEGAVAGPGTPEFASLRSRAFNYLASCPDGTRLAELERALGVSRFQMARAVRSLTDEGKAEKRGLLYFAI